MARIAEILAPFDMQSTPASSVKTLGWKGLMRIVAANGKLMVTSHGEPEGVILSLDSFSRLMAAANLEQRGSEVILEQLRREFDEQLACLLEPDAGDRMRAMMDSPAKLGGKVKAGEGF